MDSADRLKLAARVAYYIGWISFLCGGLVQFSIGKAMFQAITINKRNLFEVAVVFFIISIASATRAVASANTK